MNVHIYWQQKIPMEHNFRSSLHEWYRVGKNSGNNILKVPSINKSSTSLQRWATLLAVENITIPESWSFTITKCSCLLVIVSILVIAAWVSSLGFLASDVPCTKKERHFLYPFSANYFHSCLLSSVLLMAARRLVISPDLWRPPDVCYISRLITAARRLLYLQTYNSRWTFVISPDL